MSWLALAQFPSAPTPFARNSHRLWVGVIVLLLVTAIAIPISGLSVDFKSNPMLLVVASLYGAAIWFYSFIRRDERLVQPLIAAAQLFLILLTGLLLSYAVATLAPPYRDAELLAIDQWLGFDRPSYVALLTNQPWKERLCNLVYLSMLPQVAVTPFALIFTNRIERLQWFAAAYGLALVATIAIFTFMPAVGAFVYFDITPEQYATLPADLYTPAKTLDALRSGAMKTISLSNLEGLIAFPSFHTAAALLYAWAMWPVKPLRWIVVPLNAAMIGTTPICGAHYVVDVIAGFGVAAGSVGASRMFIQARPTQIGQSVARAAPSTA
jgi:membrane-associated phospholipid phosphatase